MNFARKILKYIFYIALIFTVLIFSSIIYLENSLSKDYKIKRGDSLEINSVIPLSATFQGSELSGKSITNNIGDKFNVDLSIMGIIPFSTVSVEVVDELHVAVLGTPFGMKIYTDGVLIINITDVHTSNGKLNPAQTAGLKKGDYIISANNTRIYTNEDLAQVVENSNGENIKFVIKRNGKQMTLTACPALCYETQKYKLGIWIKDSSAGIGTLTFYSPVTDIICGLGHGICDEDTGKILSIDHGEIVSAEIISIKKGAIGAPGQLNGRFTTNSIGKIVNNTEGGVYSEYKGNINLPRLTEIALKQEVKNGKAEILCTVDGDTPKLYQCEISLRSSAFLSKTQNLIVTVTDEELLNKTGGIVQGMSGSPLIQNGKLIGAVTHVLVDNPTKGYAIFAENMLETAQNVAESNKLKDAS